METGINGTMSVVNISPRYIVPPEGTPIHLPLESRELSGPLFVKRKYR
jgi:hypothetical protein